MVIFLSVGGGCSEGEVHLASDSTRDSASGGMNPDVGSTGSGGSGSGGEMMAMGTSGSGAALPPYPSLEEPCFVRDECRQQCPPGEQDCGRCGNPGECGKQFPWCDLSVNRCVECITSNNCLFRFGPLYGACSNGRCVQCQVDFDCAPGQECDHGWCGSCDHDDDCPFNSECRFGRCVPH